MSDEADTQKKKKDVHSSYYPSSKAAGTVNGYADKGVESVCI
jgi:hypothetical protein